MKNKKRILSIVLTIIIFTICGGIYLFQDYRNVISISDEREYSADSFLVVNTYGKNRSSWERIKNQPNNLDGATISAIEENGNVKNLITMKDVIVADAYVLNDHLYVIYYHVSDFKEGISENYKLAKYKLEDLNDYTITEYISGEIIGVNSDTGELIKRSSLQMKHERRSNVIIYKDSFYYIDGKDLVSLYEGQYEIVCSFDETLNDAELLLTGDFLYVMLEDGYGTTKVRVINLNSLTNNLYYETASYIADSCIINDNLYILLEKSILCLTPDGRITNAFSAEVDSFEYFKTITSNDKKQMVIFSNQGIRILGLDGKMINEAQYNSNIEIQDKIAVK